MDGLINGWIHWELKERNEVNRVFLDTLIASTHVIYHLSFITAVKLTLQSTKQYIKG